MDNNKKLKNLIVDGAKYKTTYSKKFENRKKWERPNPNIIKSLIPGTIIKVNAKKNRWAEKGDVVLLLEAMKMQNKILMPFDGKIIDINVKKGEVIPKNHVLFEILPDKI